MAKRHKGHSKRRNTYNSSRSNSYPISNIDGFEIQYTSNGSKVWVPSVRDQPNPPSKKKKFVRTVSEEQINEIAFQIFGGNTYFAHQQQEETSL